MSEKGAILVVDDEEIVLQSVKRILAREGYVIETALRAEDALTMLGEREYELVITDLMMPEMNGIELMHNIRKQGLSTPFLMITGYPTIRTAMQALRLGALDYIPKPFTRAELLGPVSRAAKRKADQDAGGAPGGQGSAGAVMPGDRFVLPEHSWAAYDQDGTVALGIEDSFLRAAGEIQTISAPGPNEMIEQGYPTIKIQTDDGTEHSVFAPLSGRVVAVNQEALSAPGSITSDLWLLRIIPASLAAETSMLVKK